MTTKESKSATIQLEGVEMNTEVGQPDGLKEQTSRVIESFEQTSKFIENLPASTRDALREGAALALAEYRAAHPEYAVELPAFLIITLSVEIKA